MFVKLVDRSKSNPPLPELDRLCRMVYVQSLMLGGCFFAVFIFYVLGENLILRGGPSGMIRDITDGLEANPDPQSRWQLSA